MIMAMHVDVNLKEGLKTFSKGSVKLHERVFALKIVVRLFTNHSGEVSSSSAETYKSHTRLWRLLSRTQSRAACKQVGHQNPLGCKQLCLGASDKTLNRLVVTRDLGSG